MCGNSRVPHSIHVWHWCVAIDVWHWCVAIDVWQWRWDRLSLYVWQFMCASFNWCVALVCSIDVWHWCVAINVWQWRWNRPSLYVQFYTCNSICAMNVWQWRWHRPRLNMCQFMCASHQLRRRYRRRLIIFQIPLMAIDVRHTIDVSQQLMWGFNELKPHINELMWVTNATIDVRHTIDVSHKRRRYNWCEASIHVCLTSIAIDVRHTWNWCEAHMYRHMYLYMWGAHMKLMWGTHV